MARLYRVAGKVGRVDLTHGQEESHAIATPEPLAVVSRTVIALVGGRP